MTLTFSDEKVEQRQRNGVPREHVVTARAYPSYRHSGTAPYIVGLAQTPAPHGEIVCGRVEPRLTLQVRPRHRQRRYQHRETAQQKHCSSQSKESSQNYESNKTKVKNKF